jgi:hypothetical protein
LLANCTPLHILFNPLVCPWPVVSVQDPLSGLVLAWVAVESIVVSVHDPLLEYVTWGDKRSPIFCYPEGCSFGSLSFLFFNPPSMFPLFLHQEVL